MNKKKESKKKKNLMICNPEAAKEKNFTLFFDWRTGALSLKKYI